MQQRRLGNPGDTGIQYKDIDLTMAARTEGFGTGKCTEMYRKRGKADGESENATVRLDGAQLLSQRSRSYSAGELELVVCRRT